MHNSELLVRLYSDTIITINDRHDDNAVVNEILIIVYITKASETVLKKLVTRLELELSEVYTISLIFSNLNTNWK